MSYINIYLTRPSNHLDLVPGSLSLSPPLLSRPLPLPPLCSAPFKRAQSYFRTKLTLHEFHRHALNEIFPNLDLLPLSLSLPPHPPSLSLAQHLSKKHSPTQDKTDFPWVPQTCPQWDLPTNSDLLPPSPPSSPCSALFTRAQSHTRQDWPSMSSMDMPSMRSSHHLDLLPGTRPVQSVGSNLVRRDARYISDTAMISDSHCNDRVVQRLSEIMKINAFILQNNWFTVWWKCVCVCVCGGGGCLSVCLCASACMCMCVRACECVGAYV